MRHLFSVPPAEDSVSTPDTHCLRPGVTRAVHQSGASTCARLDLLANGAKDAKANARGRGSRPKHTPVHAIRIAGGGGGCFRAPSCYEKIPLGCTPSPLHFAVNHVTDVAIQLQTVAIGACTQRTISGLR